MPTLLELYRATEDELAGETLLCNPDHDYAFLVSCLKHPKTGLHCWECARTHFERHDVGSCGLCGGQLDYPQNDVCMVHMRSGAPGTGEWLRVVVARHPLVRERLAVASPIRFFLTVCEDCRQLPLEEAISGTRK